MNPNPDLLKLESAMHMFNSTYSAVADFECAAQAFMETAKLPGGRVKALESRLGSHPFTKAAVSAMTVDALWLGAAGSDLSTAYLASLTQDSVLDAMARFAVPLPAGVSRLLVATGAVASEAAQGAPKAVTRIAFTAPDEEPIKVAAILVMTNELARTVGPKASRLFREELQNAVVAAFNESVLMHLVTTKIGSTGTALGDLKAGLAVAPASTGYVVAAGRAQVRELALESDGRMGVGGGDFLPGIAIVPVDAEGSAGETMTIIPASRFAFLDFGLVVRTSTEADIQMSDSPTLPGQMTSLFQSDSSALLVERQYRLIQKANAIEVG